ncbi:hypothetical protein OIY81_1649 [Cryptosporidium canis]|uniref:DNL-type domain-containing protein n=1 Tax=Cryptosporidium canis TaxID=195482 RepID=A0ABQ8P3C0_9CRYT|nr:hypothetical protein OJ252_3092 [Cryptosporidium canis]KAJ1611617.1 hypothetical protein OIY81_1649 [Cryptosporidium canis]
MLFKCRGGALGGAKCGPWVAGVASMGVSGLIRSRRLISTLDGDFGAGAEEILGQQASSSSEQGGLERRPGELDIDSIQGTLDYGQDGLYVFSCVCNVCGHPITKKFSKKAYNEGVVIVRCDNCRNHHLVSDKLGWFGDTGENFDAFKFLNSKDI